MDKVVNNGSGDQHATGLNLNGNVHTGRQVQLLELIHRFSGWLNDVNEPLVSALLEGLLGLFIRVGRALNGKAFDTSREWDWSGNSRARAFYGVRDVACGLVNDPMVIGLQSNTNTLSSHTKNNCLFMV